MVHLRRHAGQRLEGLSRFGFRVWDLEVSENRGTLFGGPDNKDPTI